MKIIFFLWMILASGTIFSQESEYEQVIADFQKYYNQKEVSGIFEMMDPIMQNSLPLARLTPFVDSFQSNFGALEKFEFNKKEGLVEVYLGHFEHGKQLIHIAADKEGKLTGLLFKPFDDGRPGKFERNLTEMTLPFKGEWFTYWGGDNKRQNYHVAHKPQQGAFDFLVIDDKNKSYIRSGTRNEDYYAFGKPIYAVCDAVVYNVITGVEDNRPTQMNPTMPLGNSVVLKTANEEYIFYAHFQKESIRVKKGDVVKKGQYLGDCGNSGNSSEPHLHLHIQDGPNLLDATGARCFFDALMVNGELKTDYSPVKGDKISMPKN